MSLTNTTGADEQKLLSIALENFQDTLSVLNVFDRRRMITSKADFVEKYSVKPDAKKEFRFCVFEFIGFDDDPDEGDDDCPVCILNYRVHLFFQFVDVRESGSSSAREFTSAILDLRKFLVESKDIFDPDDEDLKIGKYESFARENNAALDKDSFAGLTGHFQDFILKIKHYGN